MDIQTKIKTGILAALKTVGVAEPVALGSVVLEHPADSSHGDFATNVALVYAKTLRKNPRELAEALSEALRKQWIEAVSAIEVAGPGFINFRLADSFYKRELETILKRKELYGNSNEWRGRKVLVEYTDPNPFKVFHIGHLMSNAIGESISRLIASQGAKVRRMCYQGDIGMHVAKTMWALLKHEEETPGKRDPLALRTEFLGKAYVEGSTAFDENAEARKEIEALNKVIFEGGDRKMMRCYKLGRKWSLEQFEVIYKKLGTKFDYYYLESEVAHDGIAIVEEFTKKGIFEKSDGAIVFKGEKYDPKLHTRVFINSQGVPTYETKELGLNIKKWNKVHPDQSIIVTAVEQSDYFRVIMKALELVEPEVAKVTEHVSHGMLRFAEGKMSSRKGNVITGESLIQTLEDMVMKKVAERDMTEDEKKDASEAIAVAAIKYSILKQVTSSDIIYDFDKSISFEGDSGPYLLYTAVRAQSVLEKAKKEGIKPKAEREAASDENAGLIEKKLAQFPEVVSRSANERAPHFVSTYLIELSALFNSWYANVTIVSKDDSLSAYKVALTQAVRTVLENGIKLLGMRVPEKM